MKKPKNFIFLRNLPSEEALRDRLVDFMMKHKKDKLKYFLGRENDQQFSFHIRGRFRPFSRKELEQLKILADIIDSGKKFEDAEEYHFA